MRKVLLPILVALVAAFAMPASALAEQPGPDGGVFILRCNYVRSLQVDPIVSPGVFPSAHLHDFFGNTMIDQNSTPAGSVGAATSCGFSKDSAAYWAPAAYRTDTGAQVVPQFTFAYYFGTNATPVSHFPVGLEMLAGDHNATAPQGKQIISWSCGNGNGSSPVLDHPYNCLTMPGVTSTQGVVAIVKFPYCWDGTGTTPADVTYGQHSPTPTGACPASFPIKLPQVQIHEHFGSSFQRGDLLTLSSGPSYTEHGDWMNAWDQPTLDHLVDVCLNAHADCGVVTNNKHP